MKGGCEQVSLLHEDGGIVAGGKYFNFRSDAGYTRGADVDHLEWWASEGGGGGEDGGVDLATVGIALYGDVEGSEGVLGGVEDLLCEEDASGAGTEGGRRAYESIEGLEKIVALKVLEEGRGLSPGDDEAVDVVEF